MLRSKRGFSLVDIAIVISIAGIFMGIIASVGSSIVRDSIQTLKQENVRALARKCEVYFAQHGSWPHVKDVLSSESLANNLQPTVQFFIKGQCLLVEDGQIKAMAYPQYGSLVRIAYEKQKNQ